MRTFTAAALILLISFFMSFYFYPQMPEEIAIHWNLSGEPDSYTPKLLGVFLMPIFSSILLLFFLIIPKIDPLKQNIQIFRKYYDWFIVLMIGFFFYLHLIILLWNSGMRFSMVQAFAPAFALLFYYCGVLVENAKRNWFIGIRTPWTLSSEKVWDKTHKLGGKLFKMVGLIALLGIFFEGYAVVFLIVPVIIVAFYLIIYSYFEYQKEE